MVTVCPSQFATRRTLFHVLVGCGLLMLKGSRLKLPVIWLLVFMWRANFGGIVERYEHHVAKEDRDRFEAGGLEMSVQHGALRIDEVPLRAFERGAGERKLGGVEHAPGLGSRAGVGRSRLGIDH